MTVPRIKRVILLVGALLVALIFVSAHFPNKPRVLAVNEVPITFWAWRTRAPSTSEVQKAFAATNAKTLFLRAGQFDSADGTVKRIRPVSGELPSSVELQLVYNGTRRFLRDWEQLETDAIAAAITETYKADFLRARHDHATVSGIQLDLDVPTRLLPKYAQVLRQLRESLPPVTKLSITGLPTWTTASEINDVLAAVDFWIPQCYGANIPTHIDERIPISSSIEVARTITKVRQLNKPFYAGLSAYSYAILYSKDGDLIELRGDIDPAEAAQNASLELIENQTFKGDEQASEVRHVYRAKSDVVLDGLIIQPGEMLVFDLPNAESLRASAHAVRENAGERLLGICVFRLPTTEDQTTLSTGEIAAALTDVQTQAITKLTLETVSDTQLKLSAENIGTANSTADQDALTIDLDVPAGSIDGVSSLAGFTSYEIFCSRDKSETPRPCSRLRANVIRLKTSLWKPDISVSITLNIKNESPETLTASATTRVNDGRITRESFKLPVKKSEE